MLAQRVLASRKLGCKLFRFNVRHQGGQTQAFKNQVNNPVDYNEWVDLYRDARPATMEENLIGVPDGRAFELQISGLFQQKSIEHEFKFKRYAQYVVPPLADNEELSHSQRKRINELVHNAGEDPVYKPGTQSTPQNPEMVPVSSLGWRFEKQMFAQGRTREEKSQVGQYPREADFVIEFFARNKTNKFDSRILFRKEFYGGSDGVEKVNILSDDGKPFYEKNNGEITPLYAESFFMVGEAKYYHQTIKLLCQLDEDIAYYTHEGKTVDLAVMISNGTQEQYEIQLNLVQSLFREGFISSKRLSRLYDMYTQGRLIYVYFPFINVTKEIAQIRNDLNSISASIQTLAESVDRIEKRMNQTLFDRLKQYFKL